MSGTLCAALVLALIPERAIAAASDSTKSSGGRSVSAHWIESGALANPNPASDFRPAPIVETEVEDAAAEPITEPVVEPDAAGVAGEAREPSSTLQVRTLPVNRKSLMERLAAIDTAPPDLFRHPGENRDTAGHPGESRGPGTLDSGFRRNDESGRNDESRRGDDLELARHPERVALPAPVDSLSADDGWSAAKRQADLIAGERPADPHADAGLPMEHAGAVRPSAAWPLSSAARAPPEHDERSASGRLGILPDKQRDRSLKKYFVISSLFLAGFNSLYTALPGLFGGASTLGMMRAFSYGGQAVGNFTMGPVLHRVTPKKLMAWTWIGRSPAMFFVAALAIAVPYGWIGAQTFIYSALGLFAAEGILQSWSITAGNVVYNDIVGNDEAHFNRATAVYDILTNAVGALASLGAAFLIKTVNAWIGVPHLGESVAVLFFAATLVACGVLSFWLKIPRGETAAHAPAASAPAAKEKSLVAQMKEGWSLILKDRFLWVTTFFCTIEFLTASAFFYPMLTRYMNEVLQGASATGLFGKGGLFGLYLAASYIGPLVASIGMIFWRDRPMAKLEGALSRIKEALVARGLAPEAASAAVEKARGAVADALAAYRKGFLADSKTTWTAQQLRDKVLAGLPGESRATLGDAGFEAELDAWLGKYLSPVLKEARKEAKSGRDFLQRQWFWSTILFGAGALCYIGVFWMPAAAASLAFMLVSALLEAPAGIVGQSLIQRVLKRAYPKQMGPIYAATFLYANLLIIAGLILFVYLMQALTMKWLLVTVIGVQVASAILRFLMAKFALKK